MSANEQLAGLLADVALYLTDNGEFQRAETVIEGLRELRPAEAGVDLLQGMVRFAQKDYVGAEKSYRQGLERDANHQLLQAFLGESLIAQRRLREAEPLLAKVAQGTDEAARDLASNYREAIRHGAFQNL